MPLNHTSKYSDLTDEQFGIVGRIVVEWANTEFLLGELLSRLLLTPEFLGRVYSDAMGALGKQTAIQRAVEIHEYRFGCSLVPAEVLSEIVEMNAEIEEFRGLRNRLAHFCWSRSSDEEIIGFRFSGRLPSMKGPDKDCLQLSIGELQEIYKNAYELVARLEAMIRKLPEVEEQESGQAALDRFRKRAGRQGRK